MRFLFGILFLLSFVTVRSADSGDVPKFYKVVERPKLKDIPMYYKGQEYRYNGDGTDDYSSANQIVILFSGDSKLQNVVKVNGSGESLRGLKLVCCVYAKIGDVYVPYNNVRGTLGFPTGAIIDSWYSPSKVVFEDGVIPCKENCLKIIDVNGNEAVINELDIHDYVYNKCTLKREMFHSGALFDSFLSLKFYEGLFGYLNGPMPIMSYSISGVKTEVKGILKPAEIECIIEAVRNGKDVVIVYSDRPGFSLYAEKYSKLVDIDIFEVLFARHNYAGVDIYSSLSTVSDLKSFITDLTGISRDDVDIFVDPNGGDLGEKLGEGLELGYGSYLFKFNDKYRFKGDCSVFFECENKSKVLRGDVGCGSGDDLDILGISFSSLKEDTIKGSLCSKFAFLNNVNFDVTLTDGMGKPCDSEVAKCIKVIIKSYTNDILAQKESTCVSVSLSMVDTFNGYFDVPVNVTTLEGG